MGYIKNLKLDIEEWLEGTIVGWNDLNEADRRRYVDLAFEGAIGGER